MMKNFAVAGVLSVFAVAMAAPAFANDTRKCKGCAAPRPHYDSQEVVRTTRDVDHSRTINTQSVVQVPSRTVRTKNHLVIRKNTIRHVGVVRHNHTIIEKEIRYKRRPTIHPRARIYAGPVTVNFVTQQYRTVRRPALVDAPMSIRAAGPAACCACAARSHMRKNVMIRNAAFATLSAFVVLAMRRACLCHGPEQPCSTQSGAAHSGAAQSGAAGPCSAIHA